MNQNDYFVDYRLTPNYITRSKNGRETFVGSEIDDCKDFSGLFYSLPFHKVDIVRLETLLNMITQC